MTASAAEKVDPAHWVSVFGGAVMMIVVGLCTCGLLFPWWTTHADLPGRKESTEVSLWVRYTRMELAADDSTLNCKAQCDFTKIGSAKVRESETLWAEVCEEPVGDMGKKCQQLWVLRICTLLCWFMSLLFAVFSCLNFCGAGLPASLRIPAAAKISLGIGCMLSSMLALVLASFIEIRLGPKPPGTEPLMTAEPAPPVVGLNGLGFQAVLSACIVSVLGIAVAYLTSYVVDHLEDVADVEQGRPLADVNKCVAPDIDHQVQAAWHHHYTPRKTVEPEPIPLGTWMTN